jgi:hypothetical protein
MKVKRSITSAVRGAFAPVKMTVAQRHASSTDLFDFDSSTNSDNSDEENLQPFIVNSNSNLWFDDDDAVSNIKTIDTNKKSVSPKGKSKKESYTYENNQVCVSRRKRIHSFYDDDNVIFKSFFQEEDTKNNISMNIKQCHRNNNSVNIVGAAEYFGDGHLMGFENDTLSVENALGVNPSTSSETVPIYFANEVYKDIDDNDSIDGKMTLTSCNKALRIASQLLHSINNEEDVPNDALDENIDDLIQEDNASHIYRALYLARSLIRETYRERALRRYHLKRKRRKFLRDNGRYKKKTEFAKARPRINGKFVPMYTKCLPSQCK